MIQSSGSQLSSIYICLGMFSYPVGPGTQIQVVRCDSKHCYPLTRLTGPLCVCLKLLSRGVCLLGALHAIGGYCTCMYAGDCPGGVYRAGPSHEQCPKHMCPALLRGGRDAVKNKRGGRC